MAKELYLLVDGTHADPDECDLGADNELRHANGVPVALRYDGNPQTVSLGVVENKNVEAAEAGEAAAREAEQIVADDAAAAKGEGKFSSVDLPGNDQLLTTDDLQPPKPTDGQGSFSDERDEAPKPVAKAKAVKPAKAKTYKNRELKAR